MVDTGRFEVLVVGGGPAGVAAALAASAQGAHVGLIDENTHPGGQIYRASSGLLHSAIKDQVRELEARGVAVLSGASVIDAPEPGTVIGLHRGDAGVLRYEKLILAVGARELFLPFPGWTLPNVLGVGGLQALVKAGLDVTGKRVAVAGSGPLLLAVAAYLKQHGANIVTIAEQADMASLVRFAGYLSLYPSKVTQGAALATGAGKLPRCATWVTRATGKDRLQAIKLNRSAKEISCDYLACAFGFVPNLELPMLLGCMISGEYVKVNEWQQTSVEHVYCAGEPTGIGGVDLSVVEGRIAGLAATGRRDEAESSFGERKRWRAFAAALDSAFALRPEVKRLAEPDTTVCRCEDVPLAILTGFESARAAKLHTRCGMGPCQGRICGPATRVLFGWEPGVVRPPIFPAPLGALGATAGTKEDPTGSEKR